MPIRLRILLLALVTVIGVGAALAVQYHSIDTDIGSLEARIDGIERARRTSRLVHALQKERGQSAGFLAEATAKRREALAKQRIETDEILTEFSHDQGTTLLPAAWYRTFAGDLETVRGRVDAGKGDWVPIRAFYTEAITRSLDSISSEVLSDARTGRSRAFMAIAELAGARENLGLIRATLNRVYTTGQASPPDIVDVARYYGAFTEHLRGFARDVSGPRRETFRARVFSDVYRSVDSQIQTILETGPDHPFQRSSFLWWDEATLVIDTLKTVEDQAFDDLETDARDSAGARRQALATYVLGGVALGALVILLTVVTVIRILQALSVLLDTLSRVVSTQDFGIRIRGTGPTDEFGRIGLSVNRLLDYTDAVIKEKDFLANTDLLTGVLNRRSFLEGARRELERARRYETGAAFILCDIDHFKQINDTHGHAAGDEVLKEFSALLRKQVRESDLVGRWGGEEFVVLAPSSDLEQGAALAEKLRTTIEGTTFEEVGTVTCSFGVAEPLADEDFDALCMRADDALYKAKTSGRNRVVRA